MYSSEISNRTRALITCAFGVTVFEDDLIWTPEQSEAVRNSVPPAITSPQFLDHQRVTNVMGLNTKSPGVRRILEEAKEIQADPSVDFVAAPSEVSTLKLSLTIRKMFSTGKQSIMSFDNGIGISQYEDLLGRILREDDSMDK